MAPGADYERDARQVAKVRSSIVALEFALEDVLQAGGEEREALAEALRGEIVNARHVTIDRQLEGWMEEKRSRTAEIELLAEVRAERLEMVARAAPVLTALVGLALILVTVPRVGGELSKLKNAAAALRRGDRGARVELVGGDEFTEVASAFNDMADELERVTVAKSELEEAIHELGTTRDQLLQAQKMEALGRIAGGLAHDFNNMLLVISASAEFIQHEIGQSGSCAADVRDILDASGRARELTQQLLSLTRSRAARLEPVVLSELARDSHRMLARVLHTGIELATETADASWSARVDRSQIEQVLMNLVINARDAISGSGRITVEVRNVAAGAPETLGSPTMSGRECVVLSVRDDGAGMSEDVRQRALEPFYTTKGPGGGERSGAVDVLRDRQPGGWRFHDRQPSRPGNEHPADLPPVRSGSRGGARAQARAAARSQRASRDARRRRAARQGRDVASAALAGLRGAHGCGRLRGASDGWRTSVGRPTSSCPTCACR